MGKIDPTEHIKHFFSPTLAVGSNFGQRDHITHFLETISNVGNMFGESRSVRDGRKLR
jgi:hypothetical protein